MHTFFDAQVLSSDLLLAEAVTATFAIAMTMHAEPFVANKMKSAGLTRSLRTALQPYTSSRKLEVCPGSDYTFLIVQSMSNHMKFLTFANEWAFFDCDLQGGVCDVDHQKDSNASKDNAYHI